MSREAQALLSRHKEAVEAALHRDLPSGPVEVPVLREAMDYSLFAGGKRLRPALVLATAEAAGGAIDDALPSACAIEMVHTYSLIHDDLPCMDDDDLRRGRPTSHKKFGEGMAVLAGDALSNTAFQMIAMHTSRREVVADLVLALAHGAGIQGMIGGQVLDVESEGEPPRLEVVRRIHAMKTAALIETSIRLGAISAGLSGETLDRWGRFGDHIGQAFQIVDDILDEESDAATLGKTAGKDREQMKMTYPACLGLEESKRLARRLVEGAIDGVADLDRHGHLALLARYVCSRSH